MNSIYTDLRDENVVLVRRLEQILRDRSDSLAIVHIDSDGDDPSLTASMVLDHIDSIAPTIGFPDLLSQPNADEIFLLLRRVAQSESLQKARLLRRLLTTTLSGTVDVSIGIVFLPDHQRVCTDVIGQAATLCNQAREKGYGGIVHAMASQD